MAIKTVEIGNVIPTASKNNKGLMPAVNYVNSNAYPLATDDSKKDKLIRLYDIQTSSTCIIRFSVGSNEYSSSGVYDLFILDKNIILKRVYTQGDIESLFAVYKDNDYVYIFRFGSYIWGRGMLSLSTMTQNNLIWENVTDSVDISELTKIVPV